MYPGRTEHGRYAVKARLYPGAGYGDAVMYSTHSGGYSDGYWGGGVAMSGGFDQSTGHHAPNVKDCDGGDGSWTCDSAKRQRAASSQLTWAGFDRHDELRKAKVLLVKWSFRGDQSRRSGRIPTGGRSSSNCRCPATGSSPRLSGASNDCGRNDMGREKIKSAYCSVCAAHRKFVKPRASHTPHLLASWLTGGAWLAGYAVAGTKSTLGKYHCDTCGSVEGTRPPPPPPRTSGGSGKLVLWLVVGSIVLILVAVGS